METQSNKTDVTVHDTALPNNTTNYKPQPFETGMGPITDSLINKLIQQLEKTTIKDKLYDRIFCPLTEIINRKLQPYIYIFLSMYGILFFLLVFIFIFLLLSRRR